MPKRKTKILHYHPADSLNLNQFPCLNLTVIKTGSVEEQKEQKEAMFTIQF